MPILVCLILMLVLAGCLPLPVVDSSPARLLGTEISADGLELALLFDEPLTQARTGIDLDKSPAQPVIAGPRVKIPLPGGLKPGAGHLWSAEVVDTGRNVTTVAGKFYAANPHPAVLRLNEVRVAGSGVHTDLVELRVESPGNLGGWTVEAWSGPEGHQRTVLPDREMAAGELVVLRYKPPQEPSDSAPGAREFWQAEGKGLAGTKGLVLLRRSPNSLAVDGLLYSKKPGEGIPIAESAGWSGRTELDPSGCTATRTWCRGEGPETDWVVVANGGATPGGPNKLTPWEGQTSNRTGTARTKGRTPAPRGAGSSSGRRSHPGSNANSEGAACRPDRKPHPGPLRDRNGTHPRVRRHPGHPGLVHRPGGTRFRSPPDPRGAPEEP